MTTIKLIKNDLKQNGRMRTGFFWLTTSAGGSSCEYGDEPLRFHKSQQIS